MANKEFETRIKLKYDTYANWIANDPVLEAGEIAIATIATGDTQTVNSVATPQVLIKSGDGTNKYSALKFVSGLAADVYSWAKAATKPTYSANEITGLDTYISGQIQDTDTQYQIVKDGDSGYKYKLQSKAKDATAWTDVAGSTIEIADPTADINSLKGLVGDTAVATQITNAIAALKLSETYATKEALGKVKTTAEAAYVKPDTGIAKTDLADDVQTSLGKADSALSDAKAYTDQKIGALPAQAEYEIKKLETATEGYLASYQLEKDGVKAGEVINIPKDYLVKSATCETCAKADTPIAGLKVGDKYLDFIINTKDSTAATGDHVYVNVADLVDTYTAGTNIKIENNKISVDPGTNKSFIDKNFADAITYDPAGNGTLTLAGTISAGSIAAGTLSAENGDVTAIIHGEDGAETTHKLSEKANQTDVDKKANTADLATVATSGKINDLTLEAGTTLIFNCGDSNF